MNPQQQIPSQPDPYQNNQFGESRPHKAWKEIISTIGILVVALFVAIFIISFIFQSYEVDGPSMETTLHDQDRLIVWKAPRTIARITGHPYVPNRGDVIIFTESGLSTYGQGDTKQLIKRVIGLPGDRVVVKDNVITVYNQEHVGGFQPDKTLPYGKNIPVTSGSADVTLTDDQLFVSGDNRPDSLDSRAFGPIELDQVIGKLLLRVAPINQVKTF